MLVKSLFANGEYDRAIAACREAIRIDPNEAQLHLLLAKHYLKVGEYELTIIEANEIIRLCPAAYGHAFLADALLKTLQFDEAIAAATEAIRLAPEDKWSYCTRAGAYCHLKQWDKAMEDYSQSIILDPKHVWTIYGRGNMPRLPWRTESRHRRL